MSDASANEFRARIRRVRMKDGADITILHNNQMRGEDASFPGKIIEHARRIAELSEPGSELSGFLILGLFSDGCTSVGFRYDSEASIIPKPLLPAYAAEIVRRDVLTAPEAEDVFFKAFEWVE